MLIWLADNTLSIRELSSMQNRLIDNDLDTKILVEETADEDVIRFKIRDQEIMRIDSNKLNLERGSFLQTPANPRLFGSTDLDILVGKNLFRFMADMSIWSMKTQLI